MKLEGGQNWTPITSLSGSILHAGTHQEISKAVAKAPKRKDAVLEQATKIIAAVLGEEQHAEVEKLRKRLEADSSLTSLLR